MQGVQYPLIQFSKKSKEHHSIDFSVDVGNKLVLTSKDRAVGSK